MQHVTRYLNWYALCMLARIRWFTRITCCLLKYWLSFRWNLNRVIVLLSLICQWMQYVDDYSSQTTIITAIYLLWDFYFKHTQYRHVIINNGMRLKNSFLFSVSHLSSFEKATFVSMQNFITNSFLTLICYRRFSISSLFTHWIFRRMIKLLLSANSACLLAIWW